MKGSVRAWDALTFWDMLCSKGMRQSVFSLKEHSQYETDIRPSDKTRTH